MEQITSALSIKEMLKNGVISPGLTDGVLVKYDTYINNHQLKNKSILYDIYSLRAGPSESYDQRLEAFQLRFGLLSEEVKNVNAYVEYLGMVDDLHHNGGQLPEGLFSYKVYKKTNKIRVSAGHESKVYVPLGSPALCEMYIQARESGQPTIIVPEQYINAMRRSQIHISDYYPGLTAKDVTTMEEKKRKTIQEYIGAGYAKLREAPEGMQLDFKKLNELLKKTDFFSIFHMHDSEFDDKDADSFIPEPTRDAVSVKTMERYIALVLGANEYVGDERYASSFFKYYILSQTQDEIGKRLSNLSVSDSHGITRERAGQMIALQMDKIKKKIGPLVQDLSQDIFLPLDEPTNVTILTGREKREKREPIWLMLHNLGADGEQYVITHTPQTRIVMNLPQ